MLMTVLLVGDTRNNAQRWLQIGPLDFQPSELAKLLIVLTVASFLANRMDEIRSFKTFALSFLHVAVPMALIYKQPHLGSTLVVGVAWLTIVWIAGARMRYVLGSIVLAAGLLVAAFFIPGAMSDYQKGRILGFLHPDKSGDGYQVYRGLVAIGSGELDGKGYLKGEQKSLRFIPEQQTDFIFTVIGEEGGLIGGFIVLALFGLLFFRTWLIVHLASEPFHRMLAAGILAIFAFHMTANLGMVLQLLPVVGLWLPLMSQGGTALWLCMACIALLLNIRSKEDKQEF
jgi:rod shape determining protein RodA